MGDDSKPLTTGQAAKQLGASTWSVIDWCKAGLLRVSYTAGGHRRIDAASVVELQAVLRSGLPRAEREVALEELKARNTA